MKQFLLFLVMYWTVVISNYAQSSKNILNPDIWLRADMLNGSTVNWPDISGNLHHAISDTGKTLLVSEVINFNKAVTCNGTSNRFKIDYNIGASSQLTVIAVYDAKGTMAEQGIWNTKINAAQEITLTTQRATAPQSITRYTDKNINFPVVNTSIQFWGKSQPATGPSQIIIGDGGSGTLPFTGAISEYLVFNRILNSIELQMIHSYLAIKYGTSLLYTDYITSTGRVSWNYQLNSAFSQSIAGIGRDNGFLLNQKQSFNTSEPGILIIGAGSIVSSNEKNTYTLKDGDFLVWGDNGDLMEPDTTEGINPDNYIVPRRKWLMNVNSRTASGIPTQICFDLKTITDNPRKCWLAIDRTATGDFSSSGIQYLPADSISANGKAWFSNIKWDSDNSGTDLFTFTSGKSLSAFKKNGTLLADSSDFKKQSNDIYNYRLYPNPTQGAYTLSINLADVSDVTVTIVNSKGIKVKEEKGTGASEYIFKGELSALGIYFVQIKTSKGHETFKLIVN